MSKLSSSQEDASFAAILEQIETIGRHKFWRFPAIQSETLEPLAKKHGTNTSEGDNNP